MKTLREFRQESNLSQYRLAEILKTTRSQIALAEMGERPLPDNAAKRFEYLKEFSANVGKMPIEEQMLLMENDDALAREAHTLWSVRLARNQYQQHLAEKQLIKMKKDHRSGLITCRALWSAVETLPKTDGAPAEIAYFKDRQHNSQRKLLTCGKIAQLRLQLSIDLLVAEANLLNQYLQSTRVDNGNPM